MVCVCMCVCVCVRARVCVRVCGRNFSSLFFNNSLCWAKYNLVISVGEIWINVYEAIVNKNNGEKRKHLAKTHLLLICLL